MESNSKFDRRKTDDIKPREQKKNRRNTRFVYGESHGSRSKKEGRQLSRNGDLKDSYLGRVVILESNLNWRILSERNNRYKVRSKDLKSRTPLRDGVLRQSKKRKNKTLSRNDTTGPNVLWRS